jgi:putative oxidoreductase
LINNRLLTHPYTAFVCRVVLGVVFIYASVDKILHPAVFARAVQNYRIVPLEAVNAFAIVLPWIELVAGLLLVLGLFSGGSVLVITFLILVFLVALSSVLIRGIDTACGCFSSSGGGRVTIGYVIRDLALLLLALHLFLYDHGILSLDCLIRRQRSF